MIAFFVVWSPQTGPILFMCLYFLLKLCLAPSKHSMNIYQMRFQCLSLGYPCSCFTLLGAPSLSHLGCKGSCATLVLVELSAFTVSPSTINDPCSSHSKTPRPRVTFINSIYWPKHNKPSGFNEALSQILKHTDQRASKAIQDCGYYHSP